jgi:hypothetical protein
MIIRATLGAIFSLRLYTFCIFFSVAGATWPLRCPVPPHCQDQVINQMYMLNSIRLVIHFTINVLLLSTSFVVAIDAAT